MAGNRCFSSSNKYDSASDYMLATKQETIYTDLVRQLPTKFIKKNGAIYNTNFKVKDSSIAFAKSYELLLAATKGNFHANPVSKPLVTDDAWSGSLYSVDYSMNGIYNVVDTSFRATTPNQVIFPMPQSANEADVSWFNLYPGIAVDPTYDIFNKPCNETLLVDISFNNTTYYKKNNQQADPLYCLSYPSPIKIKNCHT